MPKPPVARIEPHAVTLHGDTRVDDYFWLRDDQRTNPEVLAYLNAENAWTEAVTAPLKALEDAIFAEIRTRTKETDLSVPYRYRDHFYYARTEEGRQYPIYCRKERAGSTAAPASAAAIDATEQVVLDGNVLAEGLEYFQIGVSEVSPDGRLLAYSTDTNGSETYRLLVKDLDTGDLLPDRVEDVDSVEWAADGRHLFYTTRDAARRPYRVYRHRLGDPRDRDALVCEEKDPLFSVYVYRTRDDAFVVIGSTSSTSSEMRVIPADRPAEEARIIEPRRNDMEYYVDHRDGLFYIRTNLDAKNFRLVTAQVAAPGADNWTELLPHRPGVKLEDIDVFRDHWVTTERVKGLRTIRAVSFRDGAVHNVEFPDSAYAVSLTANYNFDTTVIRFSYQSLTTPPSVYDHDLVTRERTLLKRTEVLGGFDPSDYSSERIFARAADGAEVPVALVYRKGTPLDGTSPLLLYGYGSYGLNSDATFSIPRLSLLDRGVIFAVASIRGGGELGEEWHDGGKMMNKRTTFTDFIACAEHLVAEGYTSRERLAILGGSAGGLLMGAVVNMRPDLFRCVVSKVPFVDVLNTMLDASLPLTVGEYLEWGNPNEPEAYAYMKSYCPYTNIAPRDYPAMLVTAGLNDPRVSYWEAAKYVARLRAVKTDDNLLLLRTNMGAGHGGASGRYDAWKEMAKDYAFLLSQVGAAE